MLPAGHGSHWMSKTLIGPSRQQTIWNHITLSYSWPTLIFRDTNPGVKCRHPAETSSETLFQSYFLRRGGLAELRFHHGNTGRGTDMAGKLYFCLKRPSGFSNLKRDACCNERIDGGENESLPQFRNFIARFERDFHAIIRRWIILWTYGNVIWFTCRGSENIT